MKRPLVWLGISLGGLAACALLVTIGATLGGAIYYLTARGVTPPPRAWLREAPGPLSRERLQLGERWRPRTWSVPRSGAPLIPLAGLRPVVVTEVVSESPAEEAGVAVQDVIIAADGEGLHEEHDLSAMVRAHEPGDELVLAIIRAGDGLEVLQIEITLGQDTDEQGQAVAYLGVFYRNLQPMVHLSPPSGGAWD
jgi:hypothetical protein